MYTIVALGNPGERYEGTRHNVGRAVIDEFMRVYDFPPMKRSNNANALYAWSNVADERIEVMFPETYMNKSGQSVKYAVDKHEVVPANIIVVHDDVSLPIGDIRVSFGRGDGGHNGITSIIQTLKTKEFIRIRVGVAQKSFFGGIKKHSGSSLSQFVLKKFSGREKKELEDVSKKVEVALMHIFKSGVQHAMQECN